MACRNGFERELRDVLRLVFHVQLDVVGFEEGGCLVEDFQQLSGSQAVLKVV